jgi:SecD/SecF fusion protein
MKSYFWRFVICFLPCVLAGWVTWDAVSKYRNGEAGGFKLGPDLEGGTILVYEIDLLRGAASADKDNAFNVQRDINILTEALKKRIDPNDLYNIVIRPAGSEGRVEMILPTGGPKRMAKAVEAWNSLIADIKKHKEFKRYFEDKEVKINVERGKFPELGDRIQFIAAWETWEKKLFPNNEAGNAAWKRLEEQAAKDFTALNFDRLLKKNAEKDETPKLDEALKKAQDALAKAKKKDDPRDVAEKEKLVEKAQENLKAWNERKGKILEEIKSRETQIKEDQAKFDALRTSPDRLRKFVDVAYDIIRVKEPTMTEKVIENWVKKRAWEEVILLAQKDEQFKELNLQASAAEMSRILPDNFDQFITFVQTQGCIPAQAALVVLEPLINHEYTPRGSPPRKKIYEFLRENYGPSITEINTTIADLARESGQFRFLSGDEVEHIKEQVKKVGSLEFRILANSADDGKAIDEIKEYLAPRNVENNAELKSKLEFAKENGLPPPVVEERDPVTGLMVPKAYDVEFSDKQKGKIKYAWVELGRQERLSLHLNNAAKDDPSKNFWYQYMSQHLNEPVQLPEDRGEINEKKKRLQGALFYARRVENRHLSKEERDAKSIEYFVLTRLPEISPETGKPAKISGDYISYAGAQVDINPSVHFQFNNAGAKLFSEITRKNVPDNRAGAEVKRHLAIILDDMVVSAPTINSVIGASGQITGNFTRKEVEDLVNVLRAGRLPATLKPEPVSENTMGPTLGADTIAAGVKAVLLSFLAVLVFMCIYYRFAGIVASIALLANLLLTVGFMVSVQATFTLPGLAGLVLMLGMAVDANVLIYERFREERERGAAVPLAIRNGYSHALPTIIDTHLSSIFTAIVLYIVGNDQLKGFGVSLTVGLVISLFTSLYMTRTIFDYWMTKGWLTKLGMFRLFARPNIDFMSIRNPMFVFTLVISILGLVLFIARLPNDLDIDFVGGTAFGAKLKDGEARTITEMRDLLSNREPLKLAKDPVKKDDTRWEFSYAKPAETIIVTFNKDDAPANVAEARKRAEELADVSLEQIFLSGDKIDPNKPASASLRFTIRTSEKEPRLLQASLLRLLRNSKGDSLLELVTPQKEEVRRETGTRTETLVYFQYGGGKDPKKRSELQEADRAYALIGYFKTMLTRHLMEALDITDKNNLPSFEVVPEGEGKEDRSYHAMRIRFEKELSPEEYQKFQTALDNTIREYSQTPQPFRLEKFDSQLATETRFRALWAILASWGAILLYLWFRFGNWTFGLAAVLCLIHDLCFTLGAIAVCHYLQGTFLGDMLALEDFKLNLPAIAALLTLVGYSVNDTIVVFDRIREVRGKSPVLTYKMINDSVNQTLSRTVLASLTTWLVVSVLYVWGGPGVHLFAFVMVIGVLVGTYSSIYIASPLLILFGEGVDHEKEALTQKA